MLFLLFVIISSSIIVVVVVVVIFSNCFHHVCPAITHHTGFATAHVFLCTECLIVLIKSKIKQ